MDTKEHAQCARRAYRQAGKDTDLALETIGMTSFSEAERLIGSLAMIRVQAFMNRLLENPALFFPFFIALWCAISFLIAIVGGWRLLAERYPASAGDFNGKRWHMRSGRMRWTTRYDGVLTIGADMRGLYLSVFFLFRVGHAPIYVPWDFVEVREQRGLVFSYVQFVFKEFPGIYLTVPERLGVDVVKAGRRSIQKAEGTFGV